MIEGYYAVDYQVHSFRSHDGKATISEQCARAIDLGLDEIGFSEHKDFDPGDPAVNYFDYDAYMHEIEMARREWGASLKILAGIEIDYQIWFEAEIDAWLKSHFFDFVLGSVHYVDRLMLMTPEYNRNRHRESAYRDYFKAVQDSVRSGLFDVVAHLEYANRRGVAVFGEYDALAYRDELEVLFDLMIERDMPLETNTAGLRHGLGITYPTAQTVALYAQRGGKAISFGSDAHQPDQLANAYPEAAQIALSNGLDRVRTWQARRGRDISLHADI